VRKAAGGFTLIEVLVAMVVAVAAMAILAQGFSTGARASATSQNATRAAMLAQQVMTGLETGELILTQNNSGAFDDDPDFHYETTSTVYDTPVNGTTMTGLNNVTVTIKWDEQGQERTYVLLRLMRDRPTAASSSSSSGTSNP